MSVQIIDSRSIHKARCDECKAEWEVEGGSHDDPDVLQDFLKCDKCDK